MSRNTFSYTKFVSELIDSHDIALTPSGMNREAIKAGATDRGEALRKKLREACEGIASTSHYKRVKEKGTSGYLYQRA